VTAAEAVSRAASSFHVTFDDAFRSVARALPLLERLGVPATVFACSGYADDGRPLDVPELADDLRRHPDSLATMGWGALRDLTERGLEIASHTVSHPHLPRLDDAGLRLELEESKARIEDELGRPCRFLAYPFGDDDARVHEAAEAAGYEAAFALPGPDDRIDRFAVPRVGMYRGTGPV